MLEPLTLPAIVLLHRSAFLWETTPADTMNFLDSRDEDCPTVSLIAFDLPDKYKGLVQTPFGYALRI